MKEKCATEKNTKVPKRKKEGNKKKGEEGGKRSKENKKRKG